MEIVLIHGSVTSLGVAYPRTLEFADMARHVAALLGPVLEPRETGHWPLRFIGPGAEAPWIEVVIKGDAGDETAMRMLERFAGSRYGELEAIVDLAEIGRMEAVLRPQVGMTGLLLDLPDAQLYPEWNRPDQEQIAAAVRELLLRWYDVSCFGAAFADHEAEFERDPLKIEPGANPFALFARPSGGGGGGAPLDFFPGSWPLSPLGA
jgi:hypothetical protein